MKWCCFFMLVLLSFFRMHCADTKKGAPWTLVSTGQLLEGPDGPEESEKKEDESVASNEKEAQQEQQKRLLRELQKICRRLQKMKEEPERIEALAKEARGHLNAGSHDEAVRAFHRAQYAVQALRGGLIGQSDNQLQNQRGHEQDVVLNHPEMRVFHLLQAKKLIENFRVVDYADGAWYKLLGTFRSATQDHKNLFVKLLRGAVLIYPIFQESKALARDANIIGTSMLTEGTLYGQTDTARVLAGALSLAGLNKRFALLSPLLFSQKSHSNVLLASLGTRKLLNDVCEEYIQRIKNQARQNR